MSSERTPKRGEIWRSIPGHPATAQFFVVLGYDPDARMVFRENSSPWPLAAFLESWAPPIPPRPPLPEPRTATYLMQEHGELMGSFSGGVDDACYYAKDMGMVAWPVKATTTYAYVEESR